MKIENVILVVVLTSFLIIMIGILIYFKTIQPKTLLECKMDAWEDCGLTFYNDTSKMCYDTDEWKAEIRGCEWVDNKTDECWDKKLSKCEVRFPNG